ncbi:MAG: 3-dehydroquinate synthase [Gammaproteobacteria bacterium]|nr:MAG: 3-dehydroquinate synthase [Gammaproteobacteria bacterium]
MTDLNTTVTVELAERSYPIYIGQNLFANADLLSRHIRASQVVLISNTTVAKLALYNDVKQALGERSLVSEVILPDGEQYKNLTTLSEIFDKVLSDKHSRSTTFIAIGGGVVGDMAGFAAACYQRGVAFVQVPTTLLAQVDSSVGGKTAVNHPLGKNMIGAFYQPQAVLIDTRSLLTLPKREYAAGLAEVIKYGLICDKPFYEWLHVHLDALLARDQAVLAEAICRSCENKARVVAMDEREGGVRAWLNLGHTFGHAIETAQGYGSWLHGEAVAAGMVLALRLSKMRGQISEAEVDGLVRWLERAELPIAPPAQMGAERFLELMALDKKVLDGTLRFIILKAIGEAEIVSDVTTAEITALIQ